MRVNEDNLLTVQKELVLSTQLVVVGSIYKKCILFTLRRVVLSQLTLGGSTIYLSR